MTSEATRGLQFDGGRLRVREINKRVVRGHQEDDLQVTCVTWFRLQYPKAMIFAIPNGGRRSPREAQRLKNQGVLAGVPDLFVPVPSRGYHGLFIELKVGANKPTRAQAMVIGSLMANEYAAQIARTIDEFQQVVKWYLAA